MGLVRYSVGLLLYVIGVVSSFPEQGIWEYTLNETESYFGVYKSLFNRSEIYLKIQCNSEVPINVTINWVIRETPCWDEYAFLDLLPMQKRKELWQQYYEHPVFIPETLAYEEPFHFQPTELYIHRCENTINLPEYPRKESTDLDWTVHYTPKLESLKKPTSIAAQDQSIQKKRHPVYTVPSDGVYLVVVHIQPSQPVPFEAKIKAEMLSNHGYLSAADWPLLPFYGIMCILYVFYGLIWLTLSFCQWRDLLRIQFWIGGVIFLGMLETAVFYAEYQNINATGTSVAGAVLTAEIISCAKRTLARMLVVIVSVGFGIVKPRLGETFHRVVIVGGLYFGLASMEATLRILHPVNDPNSRVLMAGVPLSLLDAGISWWIFQSLLNTMRTLRLRRNVAKLSLYRSFTSALIFAVIASIVFMVWSIRYLKSAQCLRDWKDIWFDEAYWHMLFAMILLVIMILWRPTNNNQRYAFTALIDNPEDEEEEDLYVNESFSDMKLRQKKDVSNDKATKYRNQNVEEELRWVDENIPLDIGEGDLPALDSDEELISSKFELSKMQ